MNDTVTITLPIDPVTFGFALFVFGLWVVVMIISYVTERRLNKSLQGLVDAQRVLVVAQDGLVVALRKEVKAKDALIAAYAKLNEK